MIKEEYENISNEEFVSLDKAVDPIFKNRYVINKLGWIKNKKTKIITKAFNTSIRYPRVSFRVGNIKKTYSIHILLAKIFLINDDPDNKIQVDHIDRNPLNYSLSNLRWVTVKENLENRSSTKSNYMVFRKYDENNKFLEEIKYSDLPADEISRISNSIRANCKHNGYYWKRVNLDVENYIKKFGEPLEQDWKESRFTGIYCNKNGLLRVNNNLTIGSEERGGYRIITINRKRYRLHRLIYETFNNTLLNEDDVIDHINCNPSDNRLFNLKVGSQRDNMNNINTILKFSKKIIKFSLNGDKIKVYNSVTEAARDNDIKSRSDLAKACDGRLNTCHGFLWCYL